MESDRKHDRMLWILMGSGLLLLVLAIRSATLWQSLWYDEMYSIEQYIAGDWRTIVAGAYSPNNHILFTLLAKVCAELGPPPDFVLMCRLPSAIAGCVLPVLLAWPLLRSRPCLAGLLIGIGIVHPWLVSYSGWARGYALLLCLAVAATLLLQQRRWAWYALAMAGVLYTHPLGIVLLAGHVVAVLLTTRTDLRKWALASAATLALAALLYAPLLGGGRSYFSTHQTASISYSTFLSSSFSFALAGDSYTHWALALASLLILATGITLALGRPELRIATLSFGVTSILQLGIPLALPVTGETRSMVWLIPVMILALFALLTQKQLIAKGLGLAGLITCVHGTSQAMAIPGQPMREAVLEARQVAGTRPVVGIYMGAFDTRAFYAGIDRLAFVPQADGQGPTIEQLEHMPPNPVLIIFYPEPLQKDHPEAWKYIQHHFRVVSTLPGRISPSLILEPR